MLCVGNQPFKPNKTAASNTTYWVKDEYLQQIGSALNNLSSIPVKDIRITNKSIDDFKNASNLEIMAEIIATWNLTQYNVLSGIKNVLELNDRILHFTQDRNKVIGQCMKRLNCLEKNIHSLKITNEINNNSNYRINNTGISKKATSVNVTDIANPRITKTEFKLTPEQIPIQNTNKISNKKLQLNEQAIQNINTNLCGINIAKIELKSQSHCTTHNMETPQKQIKSKSASIKLAQPLCKPIAKAISPLPNAIDHMNRKANKNENNLKIINTKSKNRKRNRNLNNRKKKKSKNKKKKNKQKQKHQVQQNLAQPSQEVYCGTFEQDAKASIELKRAMAIHFAKQKVKNSFHDWDFG